MATDRLTAVIVSYRKNRLNNRILFGSPIMQIRRGWRRELAVFEAGQVFAYERWRGDQYGTQDWRIFVCLATFSGAISRIPGVMPGANILFSVKGKSRVKRTFGAFDLMKSNYGALEIVTPARWRRLHNDLENGAFDPEIL